MPLGFPGGSDGRESTCTVGDLVRSLGWEDPLEKGATTHLENTMDRGVWQATVHGVTKSWTWLSDFPLLTQPYHTYVLLSERLQASVAPSSPPQFTAFITTMVRECFAKDMHMLLTILLIGYTGSIQKMKIQRTSQNLYFFQCLKISALLNVTCTQTYTITQSYIHDSFQ